MADTTTTNLGLTKPEVGASADTWGNKLNTDLDLVDALFAADGTGTSVGIKIGAGKTAAIAGTLNVTGTLSGGIVAPLASPTFTGTVVLPSTTSIGPVSSTEIGYLDGVTSNLQTQLDGKLGTATAASTYAPLSGPTFTGTVTLPSTTSIGGVSASEIVYLDGVTSNVQTQLDAKAGLSSPAFTGTPTAPTASTGTNTTQVATTAFVQQTAFNNSLPFQSGNAGKYVTTDGTNASWAAIPDPTPSQTGQAGKFLTTNGTTTSWGSVAAVATYTYDNRANIRAVDGPAGAHASIEGLGIFAFVAGDTSIDDDETCFATASGRWLLYAVSWDYVDALTQAENSLYGGYQVDFSGASIGSASTVTYTFYVPGVVNGDTVVLNSLYRSWASAGLSFTIEPFASGPDEVTVSVRNNSTTSGTFPAQTLQISIVKGVI